MWELHAVKNDKVVGYSTSDNCDEKVFWDCTVRLQSKNIQSILNNWQVFIAAKCTLQTTVFGKFFLASLLQCICKFLQCICQFLASLLSSSSGIPNVFAGQTLNILNRRNAIWVYALFSLNYFKYNRIIIFTEGINVQKQQKKPKKLCNPAIKTTSGTGHKWFK
jgi:hypothetical protein